LKKLGKPKRIIIHCSDSEWGTVEVVRQWHRERGFDDIGYHFLITNGKISTKRTLIALDGAVCLGRSLDYQGAHTYGFNKDSIGICLIGVKHFTEEQLFACRELIADLLNMYPSITEVKGHRDYDSKKTCPNFDVLRMVVGE
jgi:hypothetical protein